MRAFPASAGFAIGAIALPIVGLLSYAGLCFTSEWRGLIAFLALLFWLVPGVFGVGLYQLALARRCRRLGAEPLAWAAFLLGVAFSPLPLVLIPIAHATNGRINPLEGLLFMPVAGAALGLAMAGLTPLRCAPPGGRGEAPEIPDSRF
ncbi:MAG TPA: hypothetical protein VF950_04180 [Planctomycetota bacterium]